MKDDDSGFEKPHCPRCGRGNVRNRVMKKFEDKPFRCNICGNEWKPEDEKTVDEITKSK